MLQSTSKRRAKALSSALFLIAIAVISFFQAWWPGIMLAIGLPLALRQYLLNRIYDMWVSLAVFGGVFIMVQFPLPWDLIVPVLSALGGIYLLFREYVESKAQTESEQEEDLNHEIEEEKK